MVLNAIILIKIRMVFYIVLKIDFESQIVFTFFQPYSQKAMVLLKH